MNPGWISDGWMPALWAATAVCILLAAYIRIVAPAFTALLAHSFFGYHVRRMKKMLRVLHGDREKLARVNRVRKLDRYLPALTGITLIGWSVHFSGLLDGAYMRQWTLVLAVAASLIAVTFDYVENARVGAMVDALPAEPADTDIRTTSRVTALKLWSYTFAIILVLFDAGAMMFPNPASG